MTTFACLLFVLARPAAASEIAPVPIVENLSQPALMGDFADASAPLRSRVEWHAERIVGIVPREGFSPPAVEDYLLGLSQPEAHPVDRAAAGVIARAMIYNDDAVRLLRAYPDLAGTPVRALPLVPTFGVSYRVAPWSGDSPVAQLAAAARYNPNVAEVFDGRTAAPKLQVSELALRGEGLFHDGRRLQRLGDAGDRLVFEHPTIPAAAIHLVGRGYPLDSEVADVDYVGDGRLRLLSRTGVGPLYLGRDFVYNESAHNPRHRDRSFFKLYVMERVEGRNLERMAQYQGLEDGDEERVRRLLLRAGEAGYMLSDIRSSQITVGATAADPVRKAILTGEVVGRAPMEDRSGEPLRAAVEKWMKKFVESVDLFLRARTGVPIPGSH